MGRADSLNRVPVLTPRFGFTRLQKTEIRLVIGIDPCHNFDIGGELTARISIGQIAIPGIPEFVITPGPLLFAWCDVMVGIMDDAGLRGVIVATEEIFPAAHAHVGGGDGDICIE